MIARAIEYKNVDPLIVKRWSPRAMSGELLSSKEIETLFLAAQLAPSSYNNQPWRFIYAEREMPEWDVFFDLLVEFNQGWAKDAALLIVAVSSNTFAHNGEKSRTHSFDTGAACENLALQGTAMGLVVHGMEGFDYDKARTALHIPEGYTVEAMFAVGKPGDISRLPEALRDREKPSPRNPLNTCVFKGTFKN